MSDYALIHQKNTVVKYCVLTMAGPYMTSKNRVRNTIDVSTLTFPTLNDIDDHKLQKTKVAS